MASRAATGRSRRPVAPGGRDCLEGLERQTSAWRVEPVEVLSARSTFFDDPTRFPAGTAALDGALLMRNVPVTWNPLPPMSVEVGGR